MTTLRLDRVTWVVGDTVVIEDIGFDVLPGTFTGLIGPNGSGKSTLLTVASGVRRPTRGAVTIDGQDVHELGARDRARRIAYVEQEATTELDLRVEDVVGLGRTPHRSRWSPLDTEDHAVTDRAMHDTAISHLRRRRWATLSGGERQRTQIARALAQQPDVLLLDEPSNHLDLGHQLDMLRLVRGLGLTTLAALHDLELAAAFCDRIAVLDRGRLVAYGTADEVITPELISGVYGVAATVIPHPGTGRPHVIWDERADARPARRPSEDNAAEVSPGSASAAR